VLAAAVIVGSGSPLVGAPSIGDAVADASATIADNLAEGPHLGFDTFSYPGDDAMTTFVVDNCGPAFDAYIG